MPRRYKSAHNPTNHMSQGEGPFRLSEYKHVYNPHPLGIRENFKPTQQPIHGGEFQDKTTQRTDYKAHPLERPFVHKPDQYEKPQGDMENMTSYKQEYVEKHAPPAKAIKNEGQRMIPAKFEGEPTYRSDYKKWDGSRPQPYGMQAAWEPPKSKFEGQTTFQTDYRSKELAPRQSFKPTDAAKMSDTPFEDRTSHRDAYIQHAMPPRYHREREQYRPTDAQFDGLSTFRRDYKGALGEPTQSFKPAGQAFLSEAPFEDSTTNRHDFKKWPMERPFVHAHEPYQKPAGEMETSTTHKSTYREMPIDRVVAKRPVSASQSSAPFDGTTNYNSDFKKWNGERAQMPRQPDYVPNNAPFEGNSTYKGHYVPHQTQPVHSFRPDNNAFRSDAQFDDHTLYRQDYTAKPIEASQMSPQPNKPPVTRRRPVSTHRVQNVYKPHPLGIRENFKPNAQPIHGGEFQDKTTQRTDYHAHPLERPFVHKPDQYVKPAGDMENMTSYKQEYVEKHAPPAKAIRNDGQRMIPAKFEGEPTYRSDYKKWDGSRPQPYGMQAAWEPPKSKFEGQTTFQTDYRSKELAPRQSFKPSDAAKMSDTPFEDRTSHRDAYIQHSMPPRYQREREQYRPTDAQFDGLSTFRRDYKGALGEPTHSFKPAGAAFQSEAPFEDSTTNRHDFKKWPMERPFVHAHEPYQKPAGEMETSTTHKSTYREMPIDRVVAKRPASVKQSNAPFDGTTNYNSDYRKWNGERAQAPRQPDYIPNNAPFEGNSTYKGHYVPHQMQPVHSFRPDNNAFRSDAQFDDHTMYRQDYTAKPIEVCEAAVIDNPNSRFRFAELDNRGHRQYAPIQTTITPLQARSPMQSQQRLALGVA